MSKFQILCVTMHQDNFNKLEEMNINSDVIFANQADCYKYEEKVFNNHTAKMITTKTRGVGINRNMALEFAEGEICLFADDDVVYVNDLEEKVLSEFNRHPKADIFIFNFETDSERKQIKSLKTKKYGRFSRLPFAGFRIAFRLSSVRKANVWFTTLFGGGCIFPSGEDSMWLNDVRRKGLNIYVSKEVLGKVSFEKSTWFDGVNEKFFYGKGAYYQAVHPKTVFLWKLYFALRTRKMSKMKFKEKLYWMKQGQKGYQSLFSYDDFKQKRLMELNKSR